MDVWSQAAAAFGLAGPVTPLVGERTVNAAVAGQDGDPMAVLKLHRPEDRDDVALETAALQHLSAYPRLTGRAPGVLVTEDGATVVEITTARGVRLARGLTWVSGRTWGSGDATPQRLACLGRLVAELDLALAGFDHPGAGRRLRWNLLEADSATDLLAHVGDEDRRRAARAALEAFTGDLAPHLAALAGQVIHNDANPANIVLDDDGAVRGLIDFGDLCRAPRICGLAVALAYAVGEVLVADLSVDPVPAVLPLVTGYHEVVPLSATELALLVPLARTRLAVSVVMAGWQHHRDPGNAYLLASQDAVWPALRRLMVVDDHLALCRLRDAVGLEPCPRSRAVREHLMTARVAPVLGRPIAELGYQIMDWSGPEIPRPPQVTGEQVLVGRYLEDRAVYTTSAYATADGERRTVHLAVDLFLPAGQPVYAPLDGVVELCADNAAPLDYGPVIVLRHDLAGRGSFFTLYGHLSRTSLAGVRPGQAVTAGQVLATIGTEDENGGWAPHVHLQILTDLVGMGTDVPGVVRRSEQAIWASLCPDPNLLVRLPEKISAPPGIQAAVLAHLSRVDPDLALSQRSPVAPIRVDVDLAEALGDLAARMCLALNGFFHPEAGRPVRRDVRRLADRTAAVPQRVRRALAALPALPAGVQHGRITADRVVQGEHGRIHGVAGFDQVHHTAAVCDLAGTIASVLVGSEHVDSDHGASDHGAAQEIWPYVDAVLRGYQRRRRLQAAEVDVLGELVLGHLLLAGSDLLVQVISAIEPSALRARVRRLAGLGAPGLAGAPRDSSDLQTRRRAVQAGSLSPLFYTRPLDIVAGEGVWLIDRGGRRYLDGYNNVAVVGHSHPRVVQAISRQTAVLHTHSRYLHPNVIELAERLVAGMPAGSGLDTCLFTTSGTEANELAWRLAIESTGGDAAVIGSHAYHGASKQMADLSSNEWPPGYRPPRVATFDGPVQDEAALTRAEGMARIASAATDLALAGHRPAMVVADSMFTSDGVRTATAEFMTALVDGAHAAGALYVADEVQVGFARTGPQLWRFAALGMRPDVVTLGKPMGAGYPIGAVLTRREIADALAARYQYFSTFAANPVAGAAGLAVLDLIEDGDLGGHALRLGQELRTAAMALRERHAAIGQVRGVGLIAGIDLPSPEVARAVFEGMKERGVLVGRTGRRGDVLKVRPPLVWRREHVDLLVAALDEALDDACRRSPH